MTSRLPSSEEAKVDLIKPDPKRSFAASSLDRLSDDQLIAEVKRLAGCEREVTAELIAHLAELDARRLYLGKGYASLFVYCTGALRLSEHAAYNRIEAARAARRFPLILDLLREGSLNLTTLRLLAPHLTCENHQQLLASASGSSRREVEELLAGRYPRAAVPPSLRKVPASREVATPPGAVAASALPAAASGEVGTVAPPQASPLLPAPATLPPPSRRAALTPLAPDLYKLTFTARAETCQKLRRAQDLLRHQIPDGNPAEIFDRALSALLEELERKKLAATERPRPGRARIPDRGTSRPRSGAPSGCVTTGVAPSWHRTADAAPSEASWNSITPTRMPPAAGRRSSTSRFDAVPTTDTRLRSTSARRGPSAVTESQLVSKRAPRPLPSRREL